ncbi:MAG: peptide deformylase [Oscillospiraceae bacterium]|nr:peptide deformylase [Oscillospiraceae bacterium]
MAIRKIVRGDDPILRQKSRPVEKFDQRLAMLIDDLAHTMNVAEGCGLAAVQVGVLRRVAVIDTGDGLIEMVNPEVIATSGRQRQEEGCLSFPGERAHTVRPMVVKIKAQNRHGKWFIFKASDLKARAFLHEVDHMDGIVFKDRMR